MAVLVRRAPGVLVYERQQRRWEAALKRQLSPAVFVRPCKTAGDVQEQLAARPRSVVVIDLASGGESSAVLSHVLERRTSRGIVALAGRLSIDDECLLRELGLTSVFFEPVSEETVARQCLRLLERE